MTKNTGKSGDRRSTKPATADAASTRAAATRTPRSRTATARTRALSSDEIFDRILLAIMEHKLPPGTQLIEERLANIFKVSRTKVREAIGRLVHDCIAINIPNRGAFVASPTPEQAREVFAARRLIEPALIRELARTVTPAQIETLRAHVRREEAARHSDNPHAIIPLTGEFHLLMADMSGNSILARTIRELEMLTVLIIILFSAPYSDACPDDDHAQLVDAIAAHDEERAVRLMLHHLEHIEHSVRLGPTDDKPVALEDIFN
ncbi:GntR family transcriptional regulator [Uliginosibacterium sp. H1]|uniref:GntR family transcriptional regulator n=1 Tax=Uliginosibacterium sp. H1 TaxID=3114757 RepID=UPI002E1801FE|nr:GntR family transcriptional regulator [Uliginosibacterium sp. H1]